MIRALPALALVFVLLAAACSSGGDDDESTATSASVTASSPTVPAADCSPARERPPGVTRETLASGGIDRQYMMHVPEAYDGETAVALVLVLHPFNGNAQSVSDLTGFGVMAEARGDVITVFPEGTGTPQSWNAEAFENAPDDVRFLRDLVTDLEGSLCIDPRRVFATGYSNGGAMALRAACDVPDIFGAVAPVAAPYPACQAAVPIIAFHGSLDATVPYEGGVSSDGVNQPPVHRAVSEWAGVIGCDALPVISRAAANVELATYARCPLGDNEVLLYTVLDGGHTWPGAAIDYPVEEAGVTTHAVNATELILDFFEAHPLP
jgi:polyhydroxybutyrate depolymerase